MNIKRTTLREQLNKGSIIIAPGAYDAIGAKLIQEAGFSAVYMTGAGTSASKGYPDFGLLTMTEMVDNASIMAKAVDIPIISDADTGYGNELNVTRAVREFERQGVAAIHIEDQVSPKRCGHLDGKQVITATDFASKIRAAVEARRSEDFLIIARTDSRAVNGFEDAIARANLALEQGADLAFIEAAQTMEEVMQIPKLVKGPCLLNVVPGGKTPIFDLREAETMGYKMAILPGLMLKATLQAGDEALNYLKNNMIAPDTRTTVSQSFRRFGADDWDAIRIKFNAGKPMN